MKQLRIPSIVIFCMALFCLPGMAFSQFPQTVMVDYYTTGSQSPNASTTAPLQNGVEYTIRVEGTFSSVAPASYSNPCFANFPIFPSPGAPANGPVNFDAGYNINSLGGGNCGSYPVPANLWGFRLNNAGGYNPLPSSIAHSNQHVYAFNVFGQGDPVSFRLFDPGGKLDNYGQVEMTVSLASSPIIPTLSEWGLVILALLILIVGALALVRHRKGSISV